MVPAPLPGRGISRMKRHELLLESPDRREEAEILGHGIYSTLPGSPSAWPNGAQRGHSGRRRPVVPLPPTPSALCILLCGGIEDYRDDCSQELRRLLLGATAGGVGGPAGGQPVRGRRCNDVFDRLRTARGRADAIGFTPTGRPAPPPPPKPLTSLTIGGWSNTPDLLLACRAWAADKGPAFFENLQGIQTIEVLWWVLAQGPPLHATRTNLLACDPTPPVRSALSHAAVGHLAASAAWVLWPQGCPRSRPPAPRLACPALPHPPPRLAPLLRASCRLHSPAASASRCAGLAARMRGCPPTS